MTSPRQCPSCGDVLPADAPTEVCNACLLKLGLPDQPALAIAQPERFGDYELLVEIARGGMGVVYKARQISLDRIVALKLVLAGQFANETERKRFQFEAESAAQLEHPNIVPIYDVGEHGGRPFLTLKLITGGNLADRIKPSHSREEPAASKSAIRNLESATQPPAQAAALVAKIARAVHFAHQHGIIHRDLKPSNILLDKTGEPHVTDFGLAKAIATDGRLTVSDAVLGSPYYMSPEQAAGKTRSVSTAADVYSLGVILYELLTGQVPFKAESPLATLKLVAGVQPSKPRSLNPAIEDDLETICLKCLDKDPANRYASAEVLAQDLDNWREGKPISARRTSLPERVWKWVKREPLKAALSAVIALAVIGPLLVVRYYQAALPLVATHHAVHTPTQDDLYLLRIQDDLQGDRCTDNFWQGPFEGTGRVARLEFVNVPPELLADLRCVIRADIAGRPDPARTPVLTNGQIFHLKVGSNLDRDFYVASVGWAASNLVAATTNPLVRLALQPGGDRQWHRGKK